MGDRISIQFVNGDRKSPVLFSHWGGLEFINKAQDYLAELRYEARDQLEVPLYRLEPDTVIVDFIRHLTKDDERVSGNLYLCCSEEEGDNSDNGHWIIDLEKNTTRCCHNEMRIIL